VCKTESVSNKDSENEFNLNVVLLPRPVVTVLTPVRLVSELVKGEAFADATSSVGVERGQHPGRALLEAPHGRE
jgi:hypothetical protein